MTEQMQKALQLTDKQYKKIYKLNLRWLDARTEAMPEREAGGSGSSCRSGTTGWCSDG